MSYIKVWCEYDFGGSFGGNNNEGVFEVPDSCEDIESLVLQTLTTATGMFAQSLDGLYDWEFITIETLGETL